MLHNKFVAGNIEILMKMMMLMMMMMMTTVMTKSMRTRKKMKTDEIDEGKKDSNGGSNSQEGHGSWG